MYLHRILLMLVVASGVFGAFDVEMLDNCCLLGNQYYSQKQECDGLASTPMTGVQPKHHPTCDLMRGLCCRRSIQMRMCDSGLQVALNGRECPLETAELGAIMYKECCDCCKLGAIAAGMRMNCTPPILSSVCENVYENCCLHLTNHTVPVADGGEGDRCGSSNPCAHTCRNVGDAIQCSCEAGYKLAQDGFSCIDVDECEEEIHICDLDAEVCVNTVGAYDCRVVGGGRACEVGYAFSLHSNRCEDVDECALGTYTCEAQEMCVNTPGGHVCTDRDFCPEGFRYISGLQFESGQCRDIDECLEGRDECDRLTQRCFNFPGSYQCHSISESTCHPGYTYSPQHRICIDVDECEEGLHRCNMVTQKCVNTLGGFDCVSRTPPEPSDGGCGSGYVYSPITESCVDLDECVEAAHRCEENTVCQNTIGGYRCVPVRLPPDDNTETVTVATQPDGGCPSGFSYNPTYRRCEDINECMSLSVCSARHKRCLNTAGSYMCVCERGFTTNTFNDECEDINECALGISSCPISQRCDNSIGSYICTREVNCGTGYTYNSDNQQCTDDNECELGTHNCGPAYDCHNLQGSFRCTIKTCPPGETINLQTGVCREVQCARGFRADIQGNCVDVNECETRPDTCRRNQRCHNTIGSYECKNLLNCGTGYELSEDGTQCMDLDECTTGTHECRGGQICRNRPGGYTCQCETGYIYNGIIKICEDINECERYGSYICSRTADCINTPGSYTCECHDGFRADETGKICRDINECEESTTICHQQCLNTWGSYQCHCDSGYQLAEDKRTCRDIDECSLWSGRGSLCIGYCENTPGSYACTCPQGYTLSTDGRTCQDNDECETNPCQLDELCLNTRGDKKCITITCPQNYVKDPDQNNRCTRESVVCQQGDQACINRPLAVSYNHLAFQSNMHIRPGGLDFFTMRGALWSTTTLRFEMEMVNARVPQSIVAATQESFRLKRVGANQAIIALMEPLKGPQEVELSLKMKIFSNGQYAGVAVAKIYIYVSPHDF